MVKITGGDFAANLAALTSPAAQASIGRALFVAGERIQVAAQISITEGAVSGKNHVPSKPGEPPNQDTGVLAGNIETVQVKDLLVEVSSNAPYAAALEFGTSKMAERPYMRPALEKEREGITELVAQAMEHVKRGGRIR